MFSVRRSECGVVTGVAQVRVPFLSCMQAALRVGKSVSAGGLLSRSVTVYMVKLEAVGSVVWGIPGYAVSAGGRLRRTHVL